MRSSPILSSPVPLLIALSLITRTEGFTIGPKTSLLEGRRRTAVLKDNDELFIDEEFDIDGVMAEVEGALQVAEEALNKDTKINDEIMSKPVGNTPYPLDPAIASTIGAFAGGAALGGVAELGVFAGVGGILVPLIFGAGSATAAYMAVQKDDRTSKIIQNTLGKTTNAAVSSAGNAAKSQVDKATDSVKSKVDDTIQDIASAPSRAVNKVVDSAKSTVKSKVDETIQDIKSAPSRAVDAAKQSATRAIDQAITEAKATPSRLADSAKQKAAETMEEVKATPGRVATSTKKVVAAKLSRALNKKEGEEKEDESEK